MKDENCLAAMFAPRHQDVSSGPLGIGVQCKYLMHCIFPVLKPLACSRQSRCPGSIDKLPGGPTCCFKLSPLLCRISTENTFRFHKKTAVHIYKPPCLQLVNNPLFAVHQGFAVNFGVPPHQMPLLHSGTQRKHKYSSSDVPSSAI